MRVELVVVLCCLLALVTVAEPVPVDVVLTEAPIGITVGALNGPYAFTRPEGQRFFYMYVPSTYVSSQPLPLIIYFHGYGGNWTQGVLYRQNADAETNNYIIAYGAGTPSATPNRALGWNAGTCCIFNASSIVDDVAYARSVVKIVSGAVSLASGRVYGMGFSNGGFMVERLGCEASDLFVGVGAVASAIGLGTGYEVGLALCDAAFKQSHVNYIHFHGTSDPTIPWIGGSALLRLPSALEDISRWVTRNGCDNTITQTYNTGNFTNLVWPRCRAGTSVEFMTVVYAVHHWWTTPADGFSTANYIMQSFTKSFLKMSETTNHETPITKQPTELDEQSLLTDNI